MPSDLSAISPDELITGGATCPHGSRPVSLGTPTVVCSNGDDHTCSTTSWQSVAILVPDIKITEHDLNEAGEGDPPTGERRPASFRSTRPTSRLAIASLVLAVVGIPVFGVVTGLAAIVLGAMAVGRIQTQPLRGSVQASLGILLGLADVIGWLGFLSAPPAPFKTEDRAPVVGLEEGPIDDLDALCDLDPSIRRALAANVLIEAREEGRRLRGVSTGSGETVDLRDGEALIVTNRHVIDPGFKVGDAGDRPFPGPVQVTFLPGRHAAGSVLWVAPAGVDLALVRAACPAGGTQEAVAPSEGSGRLGDPVFAIGNPYRFGWTFTRGDITQFRAWRSGGRKIRVIQSELSLHPGNSGVGLYDASGRLIGINTWADHSQAGRGLGFSIGIETLKELGAPPAGPNHRTQGDAMTPMRMRRLLADHARVQDFVTRHPKLKLISTEGSPPELYQVEYRVRGLRDKGEELSIVSSHCVEISLPLEYPRLPPFCRMLTPIFHPNIGPHSICIGDHWSAGESLASILARIGEMITSQSYNVRSPLNGEAARWTSENLHRLPLDPVSFLLDDGAAVS